MGRSQWAALGVVLGAVLVSWSVVGFILVVTMAIAEFEHTSLVAVSTGTSLLFGIVLVVVCYNVLDRAMFADEYVDPLAQCECAVCTRRRQEGGSQ